MARYLNRTAKEMSLNLKLNAFVIKESKNENCYVQEIIWTALGRYSDVVMIANK